jgi:pimeloyl-ACP methyl ester carboxylesterase
MPFSFLDENAMFKHAFFPLAFCLCSLWVCSNALAVQPASTIETIDGRQVESATIRNSVSPCVVVFEGGSRGTLDKWGKVLEGTSQDATVFAYNRPGYGNSEPATTPRDGSSIVEELRRILRHKNLQPPYILIGHSLGGLYMQLFARKYPDEVVGLVLVDSLYPRVVKATKDFPLMTRIAGQLAFSRAVWQEIEQIEETSDMVLALNTIDDKPIVRMINQPKSATAIPVDFGVFRTDAKTREQVRALYPNAKTVVVDSSHQVALTSPEIVTTAIHQVISATSCASAIVH